MFVASALLASLAASSARRARAGQPGEDAAQAAAHFGGQRHVGGGAALGFWSGAAGVVGGGGEIAKAWLSGGYMPILVFANAKTDRAVKFNGYNAAQINGDLTVRLIRQDRVEVSLMGGYKFNTVIGHGGGAGGMVLYDLGPHLALMVVGGLAVFPSALDRLRQEHGYPSDRDPKFPWLQGGISGGLVFYP